MLILKPTNPEELYKFFTFGLPLNSVKSHVVYINGFKYIRESWVTTGYISPADATYNLWFRYEESDPPRWYEVYEKYKPCQLKQ